MGKYLDMLLFSSTVLHFEQGSWPKYRELVL